MTDQEILELIGDMMARTYVLSNRLRSLEEDIAQTRQGLKSKKLIEDDVVQTRRRLERRWTWTDRAIKKLLEGIEDIRKLQEDNEAYWEELASLRRKVHGLEEDMAYLKSQLVRL